MVDDRLGDTPGTLQYEFKRASHDIYQAWKAQDLEQQKDNKKLSILARLLWTYASPDKSYHQLPWDKMRGQPLEDLVRHAQSIQEQQKIKEQKMSDEWGKSQLQEQQRRQFRFPYFPTNNTGSIWM